MRFYLKKSKRVLKKLLVGLTLLAVGSLTLSFFNFLAFYAHWPLLSQPFALILLMSALSILIYKPLDRICTKFFNHYLLRKKTARHLALMHLGDETQTMLGVHELANLVVNTFGEILHLKTVAFLAPLVSKSEFDVISAYGWPVSHAKRVRLRFDSPLMNLIRLQGTQVIVRDELVRALPWKEASEISHDLNLIRASWVLPLFVKEQLVGAIAFSPFNTEKIFDEPDFRCFKEFGRLIAVSVTNGLRYYQLEQINQMLQDAQSQLIQKTKLEAIEQLASGIAHEIHNPLTIISGKAQVLLLKKEKMAMPEPVEEAFRTIVQQTKRAADITRKLMMFSQGTASPRESLNLGQVLSDTIALISYQTTLEGIQITSSKQSEVPLFYANVHEMREIFLNLVLNAVQSMQHKAGVIHCELNYLEKEKAIEIVVVDTGPGIAPEYLEKLFNPFFTTRHEGLGLGLFLTKQIVHRYGGSIRAESRQGEGTLFMIHLPCFFSDESHRDEDPVSVMHSNDAVQGEVS